MSARFTSGTLSVSTLPEPLALAVFSRASTLHRSLQDVVGQCVDLTLTDNRRSMLHVRRAEKRLVVRLHYMFADADHDVVDALCILCRGERDEVERQRARGALRRFTKEHAQKVRARPPSRRIRVRTQGVHHDLQALFDAEVEASAHLAGQSPTDTAAQVVVTWGRWGSRAPRRSVRLGSYDPRSRLIRIHPILDAAEVPAWVLRFVLYHELLHHWVPSTRKSGRSVHHGDRFRRLEASHPDHGRYEDWAQEPLSKLMRRSR